MVPAVWAFSDLACEKASAVVEASMADAVVIIAEPLINDLLFMISVDWLDKA